jgi:hypothetical protein
MILRGPIHIPGRRKISATNVQVRVSRIWYRGIASLVSGMTRAQFLFKLYRAAFLLQMSVPTLLQSQTPIELCRNSRSDLTSHDLRNDSPDGS